VVVPTSNDVTLSYGLTKYDWLGRVLTILGLIGLLLFGLWAGAQRFAAGEPQPAERDDGRDDGGRSGEGDGNGGDADGNDEREDPERPPDPKRWEPAPALP
jgi:hypothetical protein